MRKSVHLTGLVYIVELAGLADLAHLVQLVHLAHLRNRVHLVVEIHLLKRRIVVETALDGCRCGLHGCRMLLVTAPRVWVAMNSRMTSQLVGSAEAFGAAWKLACVRFLARVCADVSRLMFQTVEGFVA